MQFMVGGVGCSGLSVEEAMEESEDVLRLEPTWEKLKGKLLVVVDALSVSLPLTFSAQFTVLDLDIFYEH